MFSSFENPVAYLCFHKSLLDDTRTYFTSVQSLKLFFFKIDLNLTYFPPNKTHLLFYKFPPKLPCIVTPVHLKAVKTG